VLTIQIVAERSRSAQPPDASNIAIATARTGATPMISFVAKEEWG